MRKTLIGLSGGALPVVAGISVFTVLGGTLAVVDWTVVSPAPPRGDLQLVPAPRKTPLAGSAFAEPARVLRATGTAAGRPPVVPGRRAAVRATRARSAALAVPARAGAAPGSAPPPDARPAPASAPTAPAAPARRASGPLSGVGTVAAAAAERTTGAIATVVHDVAGGVGRALPVLARPVESVAALVSGTLTGAGRLVGGLVRGLTGAPPTP